MSMTACLPWLTAFEGIIYIDPEAAVLAELLRRKEEADKAQAELEQLKGLDNVTSDGRRINIYANIGSVEGRGEGSSVRCRRNRSVQK